MLSVALVGCGSSNKGGDTTCGDFKEMSGSDQTAVIKAYFEGNGKDNPSNGELSLTRLSAVAYCSTVGTDSDPISKISGG